MFFVSFFSLVLVGEKKVRSISFEFLGQGIYKLESLMKLLLMQIYIATMCGTKNG